MPILDNEILTPERVIPLSHQRPDGIFESLIIDHEYMIIGRDTYVPVNKESIAKCKIIEGLRIFKRDQPNFLTLQQTTCDANILDKHLKGKCKLGTYLLQPETYISVSNGYSAIFTENERSDIICGKGTIKFRTLNPGTHKITGYNCKAMSSRVTINSRSTTLNITNTIVQNITYDTDNNDFVNIT